MTKCLITGGAGFIGSHLVEDCLDRGFRVIVLDDLSTGKTENLPSSHPDLEFIEGDIRDRELLLSIRNSNPDMVYVFHLAAIASVARSMEDPVNTHAVNLEGTLLLLDTFKDSGLKKFLYASSAAIYGDPGTMPLKEDFLPGPQSPYGADKIGGEYFLKIYNDAFGVPTVACRFFNVFGERQDPSSPYSGVISIFFDRVLAGKRGKDASITIFGDGMQTRDFVYVKDIVGALLYLAENGGIRGEVFNVGYGKRITILELARKIRGLVGVDTEIIFDKEREGEVRHSQASVEKLENAGFEFGYDFDEGLGRLSEFLM
jgi:UDP-glucose 4-epimerase